MENYSIKNWAEEDRPREKLATKGLASMTTAELIAILIGSGSRSESAVELAKRIMASVDNNLLELGRLGIDDLCRIKGIGPAKAISIIAAIELGRRRANSASVEKLTIRTSSDVFEYINSIIGDLNHEEFLVIYLNRANKIITHEIVSKGGISETAVDNRIIAKRAIELLASSVIVAHNHPSGNPQPSEADCHLTKRLKSTFDIIGIALLDHIIVSDNRFYSFADDNSL